MTAFLVADLIAAVTWTLDDPIEKHLPMGTRMPSQGVRRIWVRDLLTHSPGLPRLRLNYMTEHDLLKGLATIPLTGTIGGQAPYSTQGTGDIAPHWTWAAAPNAAGAGGVRARLDDMVRFAQAHLGLIDTPLAARLRSTQARLAHGFGMHWLVGRFNGQDLVLHDGGTGGYSTTSAPGPPPCRAGAARGHRTE